MSCRDPRVGLGPSAAVKRWHPVAAVSGTRCLVISPLTAEDVPAEATALKAELTEMLPFAPVVSLLIELDKP